MFKLKLSLNYYKMTLRQIINPSWKVVFEALIVEDFLPKYNAKFSSHLRTLRSILKSLNQGSLQRG